MNRSSIIAFVTVILLSVLMVACSNTEYVGLSGEITFLTTIEQPNEVKALQDKIAKEFEEKNPGLKVIIERIPYNNFKTTYQEELKRRFDEGNPPDIFEVWDGEIGYYEQQGYLADLTHFYGNMGDYFSDNEIMISSPKGKPVVIPYSYDIGEIIYRKSIFDDAGLSYPTPTWTWDNFVSIIQLLKQANPQDQGAIIPLDIRMLESLIIANGGSMVSDDGRTSQGYINSPATLEVILKIREMAQDESFKRYDPLKHNEAIMDFKNGKSGMILAPIGYAGLWLNSIADDLGFVTVPTMKSGKSVAQLLNVSSLGISSQSKNPKAAWDFLEEMIMEDSGNAREMWNRGMTLSRKITSLESYNPFRDELSHAIHFIQPERTSFLLIKYPPSKSYLRSDFVEKFSMLLTAQVQFDYHLLNTAITIENMSSLYNE